MEEESLRKACYEGKTKSQGGLNMGDIINYLEKHYPQKSKAIRQGTRNELQQLCRKLIEKTSKLPLPQRTPIRKKPQPIVRPRPIPQDPAIERKKKVPRVKSLSREGFPVAGWLARHGWSAYLPQFQALGAKTLRDLEFLTEVDLYDPTYVGHLPPIPKNIGKKIIATAVAEGLLELPFQDVVIPPGATPTPIPEEPAQTVFVESDDPQGPSAADQHELATLFNVPAGTINPAFQANAYLWGPNYCCTKSQWVQFIKLVKNAKTLPEFNTFAPQSSDPKLALFWTLLCLFWIQAVDVEFPVKKALRQARVVTPLPIRGFLDNVNQADIVNLLLALADHKFLF